MKYRVMISETCSGFATIEADSQEEAEAKAQTIMDEDGIDGFPDFDPKHRGAEVLEVVSCQGAAS